MALLRRRATARGELSYRTRSERGVSFHTSRVVVGDVAIVAKRFPASGRAVNRDIVLVHGIGVSSRYFHPLAAELASRGTVYVIDLPGYGSSPAPPRDTSIADHAEVVARYIRELSLDRPVICGHSMGAQVVSKLAVEHPHLTDRIVLLNPTVYPQQRTLWMQLFKLSADMLGESPRSNWTVMSDYLLRCGIPYYLRQVPHLLGDRIEDRLPHVRAKTLVIRGDHDPIVPRRWALQILDLLPDATFAEVSGPHVAMLSSPKDTAALINRHARR